ncbi:hypothetical protein CKO25_03285 [Thiocapsa imhoffii]|uniref:Plasmid pRiA4b Orf3-like domain-containing protein n=2 Tax=Thiocapsa imhoffii TaxID=382777 RepID=A0A9X1B7C2_9GAMM|nr:hypothetical protein [Thiocapsa imhoffii]
MVIRKQGALGIGSVPARVQWSTTLATSSGNIYQLKIVLQDSKPPIWRRLLVDSAITLQTLHQILQIAMGWQDVHLHQFAAGHAYYGQPDPEWDVEELVDEARVRLDEVLTQQQSTMRYEYDFGDGWRHKITLEHIVPHDPQRLLPICLKGKGACPPEDVGGVWGYERFLEALKDPEHEEHEEFMDWIDGDFDPDVFELEAVNAELRAAFGG